MEQLLTVIVLVLIAVTAVLFFAALFTRLTPAARFTRRLFLLAAAVTLFLFVVWGPLRRL